MARLSLYDFRDLDLMHKLAAEGGADGLTSHHLAEALGMDNDLQSVAIRSAWMRRYGFFDFDEERKLWRLSAAGERIVESDVRASTIDKLTQIPDEALVEVMAHVTSRYRHGDPLNATLLRREFAYGTAPRSAAYNRRGGRDER
jgi:kynurenine formamidase